MTERERHPEAVRFGVFELDLVTGELRRGGVKLHLQEQPFRILALLVQRPGDLVTRRELQDALWPGGVFVDVEHGLNIGITKLRRALRDLAEAPRYIETLERRGYRFIAPVEVLDGSGRATSEAVEFTRHIRLSTESDSISLSEGVHVIGRDPGASIWIDSGLVSRRHASITVTRDDVVLTDLGSRNGTFVNGRRIDSAHAIIDGDRISIGPVQMIVRTRSSPGSTLPADPPTPDRT